MRSLSDAALQLELEKAQRLVWMIEAEIWRRRTLELEEKVKKEMIIEREMAMRRANGLGFLLEAPSALPQESCFTLIGLNAFNTAPSPRPREINTAVMKRESEGSKEKLIVLPKPNQSGYEGKRKAGVDKEKSRESNELELELELELEFKKKGKEVKGVHKWRCELCNVLTTSEKGLIDHSTGKKHMARHNAQCRKIVSQKSFKSLASSCSKIEAKSESKEEEIEKEEQVDNSLNFGMSTVK